MTAGPAPCRVCGAALGAPDYAAPAPAMTSLSTRIAVPTEVSVCRACGHVQSPDLPDVRAFYDHDYRISLQSDDHDQLYDTGPDGPVFRTAHQTALVLALALPQGARVLDFGAAKAATTRRLLALRPDLVVHVFDVSEDYRPHWAGWVAAAQQATYALPAAWSGRFDLITAHFVLEHVAAPVPVLADLARCLAPGGRLFFTVPDPVGNPGDLLVADHLSHFVPSSIRAALDAAGLRAVSLRQDLFRGAHVVVAQAGAAQAGAVQAGAAQAGAVQAGAVLAGAGDGTGDAADPATTLALLDRWRGLFAGLAADLAAEMAAAQAAGDPARPARIAIYGAGFYGALFAPVAGPGLVAFLDRNPHLQGTRLEGRPVLAPEACPPVDLVIAALNPARARAILPPDAPWLPKGARILYPGAPA
jgi:SAM-dependent methyltransferase